MKHSYDKSKFLDILRENPWISFAAKKSGISRATIYRWMKDSPDFRREVNKAMTAGSTQLDEIAEMGLAKKIKEGHFQSIKYYLERNNPKYITKASIYGTQIPVHDHSNGPEICEACVHAKSEQEFRKREIKKMVEEALESLANLPTKKDIKNKEVKKKGELKTKEDVYEYVLETAKKQREKDREEGIV